MWRSWWGKIRVPVTRLIRKDDRAQFQVPVDASLDASGWLPDVLDALLDLSARVPFAEAETIARKFGRHISSSELERLVKPYGVACSEQVREVLLEAGELVVEAEPGRAGRVMVAQTDGVVVLGRPEEGNCPGMEIKSVMLYPQSSPGKRHMFAGDLHPSELQPMMRGLLNKAGVTPADTVVGLGDGAGWVESTLDLHCDVRITDVYHACAYLEVVMNALGWDEATRDNARHAWYRGEVNARDWLKQHQPAPGITEHWDDESLVALRYLTTRVDSMDYQLFTSLGYPIGSGQIEGMNKNVIGKRMKCSGMHWSREGADRMAARRAEIISENPLLNYDQLRFQAYPHQPSCP